MASFKNFFLFLIFFTTIISCKNPHKETWQETIKSMPQKTVECRDCNIIMISIDTVRYDHFSAYGYKRKTTPNIDILADRSAVFNNFIVHSYLTPISQMSIMSSGHPSKNGVTKVFSQLKQRRSTVAEKLKQDGYKTATFGSSVEVTTEWWINKEDKVNLHESFKRGFDEFYFTGHANLPTESLNWIEKNKKDKFYLWLPIGTVHYPYGFNGVIGEQEMFDPPNYNGLFKNRPLSYPMTLRHLYKGYYYPAPGDSMLAKEKTKLTQDDHDYIISRYDYGIFRTDQFIGELLDELNRLNILDKTVIIIHGVHGEDLGEHGYYGHYDIYDTELKNPLIIFNPKHSKKRIEVDQIVRAIDLAPTMLNIVGSDKMNSADGTSLLPTIKGVDLGLDAFSERVPLWENFVLKKKSYVPKDYVAHINDVFGENEYRDTSLRTKKWKLIHRLARDIEKKTSYWTHLTGEVVDRPEYELYDIINDPFETKNIISEHPKVAERLKQRLAEYEK